MPAPQQIGRGVYYVPPPGESENLFAAFTANFLATRTPWAMEVFRARLAAVDPTAKYKLIADLEGERARLLAEWESTQRVALKAQADQDLSNDKTAQIALQYEAAIHGDKTDASIARGETERELIKGQVMLPETQDLFNEARDRIADAEGKLATAYKTGRVDEIEKQVTHLEKVLANAKDRANTELGAQQRLAFSEAMNEEKARLRTGDWQTRQMIVDRMDAAFELPSEVPLSPIGAPTKSLEEVAGEVVKFRELVGAKPGTSTSTRVETTTSGPVPSAPGAPVGGAGLSPAAPARQPAPGGQEEDVQEEEEPAKAEPEASLRQPVDPNDPLLAGVRHIDAMIEALKNEDPLKTLGGFFDPLPGARPGARPASRTGGPARMPRGSEPSGGQSMSVDRGSSIGERGYIGQGGTVEHVQRLPDPGPRVRSFADQQVAELLGETGARAAPRPPAGPLVGGRPIATPAQMRQRAEAAGLLAPMAAPAAVPEPPAPVDPFPLPPLYTEQDARRAGREARRAVGEGFSRAAQRAYELLYGEEEEPEEKEPEEPVQPPALPGEPQASNDQAVTVDELVIADKPKKRKASASAA